MSLIFYKRKKIRVGCIVGASVSFLFFTNGYFYYKTKECLTKGYIENIDTSRQYKYGVILGAGITSDVIRGRSEWDKRVTAAIALYKRGVIRKVVYTGAISEPRDVEVEDVFRRNMIQMGVLAEDFILEPLARNTKEHPVKLRKLLGEELYKEDWVIITSTLHMKRALKIFAQKGFKPHYYGTDISRSPYRMSIQSFQPQFFLLDLWTGILHEQIGLLVN